MTLYEPPNKGAAATSGKSEGGIYLPPSAAESSPRAAGKLYVPPGLEAVRDLPGASQDEVPTPPGEQIKPSDFAKSSCRFCNGKGLTAKDNDELRAKEMVLCMCVEKRLAKGLGPRTKRGKKLAAEQQSWYNETNVHKEKDMWNQEQIDQAEAAAEEQLSLSKDESGYKAAMESVQAHQAELDASLVKTEQEDEAPSGPSVSDAAQRVIDEKQIPFEMYEDYSVVSVSVARRLANQMEDAEAALSPPLEPQDPVTDEAPVEALTQEDLEEAIEIQGEELDKDPGGLLDSADLGGKVLIEEEMSEEGRWEDDNDEDDEEIEDTAAF